MLISIGFMVLALPLVIVLCSRSAPLRECPTNHDATLCLQTTKGSVNFISEYTLTLGASRDVKDSFYEDLGSTAGGI